MSDIKPVVKYYSKDEFILVKEPPRTTLEDLSYEVEETIKLIRLHNCRKVLVDSTGVYSYPGMFELTKFAKDLTSRPEMKNIRFAVVPRKMSLQVKFVAGLTAKRGFRFRVFENIENAKDSLLS